jgi:hypothetical protein
MMGMGMGVHPMPSPTGEKKDPVALMRQMEEREEFSDNWDDDFADESIDPSRLAGCLSLSSVLFSLYLIALLATFFG